MVLVLLPLEPATSLAFFKVLPTPVPILIKVSMACWLLRIKSSSHLRLSRSKTHTIVDPPKANQPISSPRFTRSPSLTVEPILPTTICKKIARKAQPSDHWNLWSKARAYLLMAPIQTVITVPNWGLCIGTTNLTLSPKISISVRTHWGLTEKTVILKIRKLVSIYLRAIIPARSPTHIARQWRWVCQRYRQPDCGNDDSLFKTNKGESEALEMWILIRPISRGTHLVAPTGRYQDDLPHTLETNLYNSNPIICQR